MKIIFKKIIFKNFPFAGKTFFDGYFFVLVVKSLLLIFGAAKTLRRNTWTAMWFALASKMPDQSKNLILTTDSDDLTLLCESTEGQKGRAEAWKGVLEPKVKVPKRKIMDSTRNYGKIIEEGKFPSAVCRKGVGSNSILCQFCRWWDRKRCSGIKENWKRISSLYIDEWCKDAYMDKQC